MNEAVEDRVEAGRCWVGTDDALGDLDAVGVADRIASGEVSAAEVVEASIARAEAAEPRIAAFAETGFERARERASTPVAGRFAGLPMAIKDQTAVEGFTLRFGSKALANRAPATQSSPMATIFEQLGTVTIGTTTLPEFGLTSSSDFVGAEPTRNPWNLAHTTGGSSSGAAALVASGVLPMVVASGASEIVEESLEVASLGFEGVRRGLVL